jgi:hypothetical protein
VSEISRAIQVVLASTDARGVRFASQRSVGAGTLEQIAELTHRYVWDHGTDESDTSGWRRYPGGILTWWVEEADLDLESKTRLHKFRSVVVRHLENQGRARRDNPQSIYLHVAPPA